jgi:hypothetical protein
MGLNLEYLHTSTLPRIHQIVWCCLHLADVAAERTVRPALVRGVKRDPSTNRGAVLVSYGTSKLRFAECAHIDLILQNCERLSELDLPQAVRFDLGKSNWLPWCSEFFSPPEHSFHIVAGSLSQDEIRWLRDLLRERGIITEL